MEAEEIKSLKDERVQLAKNLGTLKGRNVAGKILIEGMEAIIWAVECGVAIDYVLYSDDTAVLPEALNSIRKYKISEGILKKVTGTNYLISEVAVAKCLVTSKNTEFVVVLDNVRDFGNLGTIVRTCHAFGIDTLISSSDNMDIFNRKTVDASRGKVFSTCLMKFQDASNAVRYLKRSGFRIVTTSPHASKVQSLLSLHGEPVALVVGNETDGVCNEFIENADEIIQIPMRGEVESLNVGVAAGISIYELKLKQVMGMIEKKIKAALGRDINVAGMLIQRVLDKRLKSVSDLSSVQLIFMMVLKCDVTMTLENIQRQFGLTDSDAGKFLEPLIARQYISVNQENSVEISAAGIEIIGKLWTVIENAEDEILKNFSEDEKKSIRNMLERIIDTCLDILD